MPLVITAECSEQGYMHKSHAQCHIHTYMTRSNNIYFVYCRLYGGKDWCTQISRVGAQRLQPPLRSRQ